jgi:hypothetical protein
MAKTIPQLIAEGAIEFHSVEAGNSLLTHFPEAPELVRLQADLLAERSSRADAVRLYAEAAGLFLAQGKVLKAAVAKSLEWRLARPSPKAMFAFQHAVASGHRNGEPLNAFLQGIAPVERMAFFARFERRVLPAGRTIETAAEPENGLWLVVSGRLRETRSLAVAAPGGLKRQIVAVHEENGFFGDLYPFKSSPGESAVIEALVRSEMIVLSKRRLIQLCWKHPNIQKGFERLWRERPGPAQEPFSAAARRGERYRIPARMTIEIPQTGNGRPPLAMSGRAGDLSVSGMSFLVDPEGIEAPPDREVVLPQESDLSVLVKIPFEGLSLSISGRIVRSRRMVVNGYKTLAFGIQFDEIQPRLRGLFFSLANAANGHPG